LRSGLGEVAQGGLNVLYLKRHSQKKLYPASKKNFFGCRLEDFEPLNSSLPLSAPELFVHKAMCDPVVLAQESLKAAGRPSVNAT